MCPALPRSTAVPPGVATTVGGGAGVDGEEAERAPFPPDWAFVLQLRAGTSFDAARLAGRIEHVRTGRAGLFASLDEARAFMERVMTAPAGPR